MTQLHPFAYTDAGPWNHAAGVRLAARFVSIVVALPGVRTVCDLGCGNGYLASLLGSKSYKVVGIDASESGIAIARATYGSKAEFYVGNIDEQLATMLGRSFDVVISSDVIEHLYRPRALVRCAATLLRPGGWLIIGTPYHGYLKNLALSLLNGWDAHHGAHWDGGHIKFFSVRTLGQLIEGEGFCVNRFSFHGRVSWLWKNMICIAQKTD